MKTILLVDDDMDLLQVLTALMIMEGYSVVGLVSLDNPASMSLGGIDAIVTDIMLRGPLSGIEIAKELRGKVECPLVGTSVSKDMLKVAKESGCFDFVVEKDPIQLLASLRTILQPIEA